VEALAALNGVSPDGILISGTALALPEPGTGTSTATSASSGTGATQYVSDSSDTSSSGGPYPTDEAVSGSEIASIADANGVPASLAQAIGWQESGWNNAEVSSVGAVGVMQIVPGTVAVDVSSSWPATACRQGRRPTTCAAVCCSCTRCCR